MPASLQRGGRRQAMFGHDPPISPRSTTAVRRPAFAIVQARDLPASPLVAGRRLQRFTVHGH